MGPDNGYSSLLLWPDGHLEDFARIGGPSVYHTWYPSWPQFVPLSNTVAMATDPVAALNPDGHAEVFDVGWDGNVYHTYFDPAAGWAQWWPIGSPPSGTRFVGQPAVARTPDGSLVVIARATDRGYWYSNRVGNAWQGWAPFGGWLDSDPVVSQNADGHLEVFALSGGHMFHLWEYPDGSWSSWVELSPGSAFQSRAAVARNSDGHLEAFAVGADNTVYHIWQVATGGWSGWWAAPGLPPGPYGAPALVVNPDGHLEVFVRGRDFNVWHSYQPQWSSWWPLSGTPMTSDPVAIRESTPYISVWSMSSADWGMYEFYRGNDNVWSGPWARGAAPTTVTNNIPVYHQQHPLTCEESATVMSLAYVGHNVSEQNVLDLIGIDWTHYWAGPGGGDPYQMFVGNPDGSEIQNTGYGTYHPPISRATSYFGGGVAGAGEGTPPSIVYNAVRWGHPVVFWVTFDWQTPARRDYQAYDGRWIPYAGPDEHAMVVSGVSPDSVRVNDPDRGQYWVSKAQFEAAFGVYNRMAVVYY
jgi:uncharacterized protein YvpB